MLSMLLESIIIALVAGCAVGAITAIHIAGPKKLPANIRNEKHQEDRG